MVILILLLITIASLVTLLAKRYSGIISTLSLIISGLILLESHSLNKIEIISWASHNLSFYFFNDVVSFQMASMIILISALSSLFSMSYMKKKKNCHLYYFLLLIFSLSMLGVVFSVSLISFYLFWDIMLISSYFLIVNWEEKETERVGLKYFIYMILTSIFLLIGLGLFYSFNGTFDILEAKNINLILLTPFILAFIIKLGLFPFHDWLPTTYAAAPTPISAMLGGLMSNIGGYALVRFALIFGIPPILQYPLAILGTFNIIFGGLMVLRQSLIKKAIAWSSVSQGGYFLFGLSTMTFYGLLGANFYLISQAITKSLLFFVAGVIIYSTGKRYFEKLGRLNGRLPLLLLFSVIGFMSLSGIPAFISFQSEFLIFLGGLRFPILLFFALLGSVLTLGYSLWMLNKIFFEGERKPKIRPAPKIMHVVLFILSVLTILLGLYPSPLLGV